MPPTLSATHCAMAIGMLGSSLALIPELIRMRTIGTVNSSTKPAPSSTLLDSPTAVPRSRSFMPCRKKVAMTTATRMPPGRYSGMKSALMPVSPSRSGNTRTTDLRAAPTSGNTRLITSSRPTST
ncbi:hypothetical protein D3C80_1056780 [compost metagenome]